MYRLIYLRFSEHTTHKYKYTYIHTYGVMSQSITNEKIALVLTPSGRKLHVLNQNKGFNTVYAQCGAKMDVMRAQRFIATREVINSKFADVEFCAKCAEIAGIEGVKVHKTKPYWEQ